MRFGIVANQKRPGAGDALSTLADWAGKNGHSVVASDDLADISPKSIALVPRQNLPHNSDVIVSMGGDGTLLATARLVGSAEVPILGINLGSLGFLTQQPARDLLQALTAIDENRYTIESRMILRTVIEGDAQLASPYSLNDVVINNGPVSRIIDIKLKVNGEPIVTYRADGLIIATPTGSTAYSMAAGGPIIQPGMAAIVVTPISSFSLNSRPLVFSSEDQLELSAGVAADKPMLTLDGQVMVELKPNDKVVIERADFDLKLIVFPENSFFKVLRRKLHWGVAPISEDG